MRGAKVKGAVGIAGWIKQGCSSDGRQISTSGMPLAAQVNASMPSRGSLIAYQPVTALAKRRPTCWLKAS